MKRLVEGAFERARAILAARRVELDRLAAILLEREILTAVNLPLPIATTA